MGDLEVHRLAVRSAILARTRLHVFILYFLSHRRIRFS